MKQKMETNLKKWLSMCLVMALAQQCVKIDDFAVPEQDFQEPQLNGKVVTIASVKGSVAQNEEGIVTFEGTDTYMEGYVISSDEGGNFFEELILQNAPEDPTDGIAVLIDENPLFTRYNFGRKVYVKLDGLTATTSNGVISLGVRDGMRLENIPSSVLNNSVIRTGETASIIPLKIKIEDFGDAMENLFIQLDNAQFSKSDIMGENRKTFASEGLDEFDGERILQSCNGPATTILSTSTYSDFKSLLLPVGNGMLQGILTRDFYDEYYIVSVNSPADISFDGSRCDPPEIYCGNLATEGATILFSEDFERLTRNRPVSGNGWTNFAQEGSNVWETYVATGGNASLGVSARMDASGSGDKSSINWLITPGIDLTENPTARLHFQSSTSFADSSVLEILASTDWDGNPETVTTATWQLLSGAYIAQNADFFGEWPGSGVVDLSCLSGTAHIAFRYTGSGFDNYDGVYEIDNIRVTAD